NDEGGDNLKEKKEINVEIGVQVRIAREGEKMTQEQLAEKIDVTPQYVSDLERGVVGISISTLKKLCVALDVSSDQILFGIKDGGHMEALEERYSGLSREQYELLANIINSFVEAVRIGKPDKTN
ncbi:MAG: helix-turn-helix transcriptional regulator, partial [Oscillospiraceae bacterium]|nr:helix-turn-helix transcriptional regulator [Oscillospiraceae bacterium]